MRLIPSAVLMWKASVPLKIWIESAFIRRANLLLMPGGSKKGLCGAGKRGEKACRSVLSGTENRRIGTPESFCRRSKTESDAVEADVCARWSGSYFYDRMVSFAEYFPKEALVVLDEPNRLWEEAQAIEKEFRESMTNRLEKGMCCRDR